MQKCERCKKRIRGTEAIKDRKSYCQKCFKKIKSRKRGKSSWLDKLIEKNDRNN